MNTPNQSKLDLLRGRVARLGALALTLTLWLASGLVGCDDDSSGGISGDQVAELKAEPNPVVFNAGAIGSEQTRPVTLQNNGSGTLRITDFSLSNELSALEFEMTIEGVPVREMLPLDIASDAEQEMLVTYRPQNEGIDEGHILEDLRHARHREHETGEQ